MSAAEEAPMSEPTFAGLLTITAEAEVIHADEKEIDA